MRADAQLVPSRRFDTRTGAPRSARPLFLLFSCLGILMGLFVRELVDNAGEAVSPTEQVVAADRTFTDESVLGPAPTFVVQVNAVLSLPTETPAPTAPPRATATPDRDPALDFCGAIPAKEGAVCRMPMPTATATATLPACYSPEAEAGKLCQYRLTPTPEPAPSRDVVQGGHFMGRDT
jgi:hypothetical protein